MAQYESVVLNLTELRELYSRSVEFEEEFDKKVLSHGTEIYEHPSEYFALIIDFIRYIRTSGLDEDIRTSK